MSKYIPIALYRDKSFTGTYRLVLQKGEIFVVVKDFDPDFNKSYRSIKFWINTSVDKVAKYWKMNQVSMRENQDLVNSIQAKFEEFLSILKLED